MNNDELHENDNEKQPNLIARTWQRLKTKMHGTKIAKRVGALVIAAAMATSLAACDFNTVTPGPDDNVKIVCPVCGENHTKDQHQNQQQQGYSVLLHTLLEDDYYRELTEKSNVLIKKDGNEYYYSDKYCYQYNPHPFAFLESQGYDVEAIKSGDILCLTSSFVKDDEPNNLYMMLHVTKPQIYTTSLGDKIRSGPWDTYLIRYKLTDQEMKDYQMLYDGKYIQRQYINDAISKSRAPEILVNTKLSIQSYDSSNFTKPSIAQTSNLLTELDSKDFVGVDNSGNRIEVPALKHFNEPIKTIIPVSCDFETKKTKFLYISAHKVGYFNIDFFPHGEGYSDETIKSDMLEDGVYNFPMKYSQWWKFSDDLATMPSYNIKYYNAQNALCYLFRLGNSYGGGDYKSFDITNGDTVNK